MAWAVVNSWTYSSPVANVDFTGLAAYADIRVLIRDVVLSVSGVRSLQVSTDNGSSFLNTTSDYFLVAGTGAETAATSIAGHATAATAARSCEVEILGFNLTTLKVAQLSARTDSRTVIIPTASALNAVRILGSGGGNLTAGSIYVYAR